MQVTIFTKCYKLIGANVTNEVVSICTFIHALGLNFYKKGQNLWMVWRLSMGYHGAGLTLRWYIDSDNEHIPIHFELLPRVV